MFAVGIGLELRAITSWAAQVVESDSEATVFTECGNPACGAPYGNSERGSIFVNDSAAGLASTCLVQLELSTGLYPLYFFWLCDTCSRLMQYDPAARLLSWKRLVVRPAIRPAEGFLRKLVAGDSTLIESRCEQCGLIILGSVLYGLQETEFEHRAKCPWKVQ